MLWEFRCRTCLTNRKKECYSLYNVISDPYFGEEKTLSDILEMIISSEMSDAEELPDSICGTCYEKCMNALSFITKVRKSQKFLMEKLKEFREKKEREKKELRNTDDAGQQDIKYGIKEITDLYKNSDFKEQGITEQIVIVNEDDNVSRDQDVKQEIKESYNGKPGIVEKVITLSIDDMLKESEEDHDVIKKEEKKNLNTIQIVDVDEILDKDKTKKGKRRAARKKKKTTHDCAQEMVPSTDDVLSTKKNTTQKKIFVCQICNIQYRSRTAFVSHRAKHENKSHPCDHCEKSYSLKSELNRHVRNIHENKLENKFLCTECGRGFKYLTAFKYHKNKHSNSRNFVCRECGESYFGPSSLKRHERIHTGERPYTCKYCGQTFAGSSEKKRHEDQHEGMYRFNCNYCDRRFIKKYNMQLHSLNHGGTYICEICLRNFADCDILKFHCAFKHKMKDVNGGDGEIADDGKIENQDHHLETVSFGFL